MIVVASALSKVGIPILGGTLAAVAVVVAGKLSPARLIAVTVIV